MYKEKEKGKIYKNTLQCYKQWLRVLMYTIV